MMKAVGKACFALSCVLTLLPAVPASDQIQHAAPSSRSLEGQVVDEETQDAVPYVNVGIPEVALGTVSDEQGRFALTGVADESVMIFSAIGYAKRSVPVAAFPADGVIPLTPVEIGYRETVSVTAEAIGEPEVLGNKLEGRGYGFGFGSSRLGTELGARIRIDGPTYLQSAHFGVAHTAGERFLYRVNVYDFAGDEVGANLLDRNLIVAAEQERGTLTVDLRDYGLVVRNDVLLTLEWIRDDGGAGNANVMFRAKPRSRANLYVKLTSQMPFRKINRHKLGFYFRGYRLEGR